MDAAVEGDVRRGTLDRHRRRVLVAVAGCIALLSLDAGAQRPTKTYRIALLDMGQPDPRSALWEELRRRGYVEGQNLVIERRNAQGRRDLLPALAGELVALHPDVIVASQQPATRAAKVPPALAVRVAD